MKKIFSAFIILLFIASCSTKKEGNMIVKGQIKGLKKGKLYLQKMNDTILVSVDSIVLLGDDNFILSDNIDTPEMYYLTFDGNTTEKRILFFGEKGTITINNRLDEFGINPTITGSKNQEILDKFQKINKRFKGERLDFIKKDFDAKKEGDTEKIAQLEKDYKKMMRRRFLFTANFAISNANSEAAPYIALTELYDASTKLLDTVNNSLSTDVKISKYGKRLNEYLLKIKAEKK